MAEPGLAPEIREELTATLAALAKVGLVWGAALDRRSSCEVSGLCCFLVIACAMEAHP